MLELWLSSKGSLCLTKIYQGAWVDGLWTSCCVLQSKKDLILNLSVIDLDTSLVMFFRTIYLLVWDEIYFVFTNEIPCG